MQMFLTGNPAARTFAPNLLKLGNGGIKNENLFQFIFKKHLG